MILPLQGLRPGWEEELGHGRQSGPKAGRRCLQGPWAALSGPRCRFCSAPVVSSARLENGATQGTWPLAHHSPQLLEEALFIRAAFLGTNASEARSGLEVEL